MQKSKYKTSSDNYYKKSTGSNKKNNKTYSSSNSHKKRYEEFTVTTSMVKLDDSNSVKASWLNKKFREKFSDDADRLRIVRATDKAYLLSDYNVESWVPISCVREENDRDAIEEKFINSQNSIKMPLLHASEKEYDDVLTCKLFQYQKDVIKTLEGKRRVYLGMEQGTGKTPVSIARAKLFNDNRNILVVCRKSLIAQWKAEVSKFAPDIIDRFYIINYDKIWRDSSKEFMSKFKKNSFHLILEEVSDLGNETAKRTAASIELAKKAYSVQMLSGSFFGGHFEKFYPCAVMQGFNGSRESFENAFTIKVPAKSIIKVNGHIVHKKIMRIVGYKNIDKLIEMTAKVGAVFIRSEDCLSLPSKAYSEIAVAPTQESKRLESRFLEGHGKIEDNALRGIYVKMDEANSCIGNNDKVDIIQSLLQQKPMVRWCIFYKYTGEKAIIEDIVKKMGRPIAEVSGAKKDLSVFDTEENAVALLQISSAAAGLNLQKAHNTIFTSIFTEDQMMQAEFRTWRVGQKDVCFYYILYTDSNIGRKALKDLKVAKEAVAAIK